MLKDKYTFNQTKSSAFVIAEAYMSEVSNVHTSAKATMLLGCEGFIKKLLAINPSQKPMKKVSMNKKEALAFHALVENEMIAINPFTLEIYNTIDRTINSTGKHPKVKLT